MSSWGSQASRRGEGGWAWSRPEAEHMKEEEEAGACRFPS